MQKSGSRHISSHHHNFSRNIFLAKIPDSKILYEPRISFQLRVGYRATEWWSGPLHRGVMAQCDRECPEIGKNN